MIQDKKYLRLKKDDTSDRKKWRRRIREADPLPWEGLIQAGRRYYSKYLFILRIYIGYIAPFKKPTQKCPQPSGDYREKDKRLSKPRWVDHTIINAALVGGH